jgi:hypothetical protein
LKEKEKEVYIHSVEEEKTKEKHGIKRIPQKKRK